MSKDNVWNIIGSGLKLYFKNIGEFTKYMLFPVFGQILGIALIVLLTTGVLIWNPDVKTASIAVILLLSAVVPGLILFTKAFWDFMVAYGALNSMTEALLDNGKLYDLKAHNQVITKRTFRYINLLFDISVLVLISIIPFFWVIGAIFFVYFILVFQVFTFEKDISAYNCFKRSFSLIKGNFAKTFLIMIIVGLIAYYILPWILDSILETVKVNDFLRGCLEPHLTGRVNLIRISPLDVADSVISSVITFIAAGLTLPMRSVVWTLWYKNLSSGNK